MQAVAYNFPETLRFHPHSRHTTSLPILKPLDYLPNLLYFKSIAPASA